MQHTLMVLMGTRPEVIKLAPVIRALKETPWARVRVIAIGQHPTILQPLLEHFEIVDYSFEPLQRPSGRLSELVAALARTMDRALDARPDGVIVQGDTTSAMVGATCSFLERIPVFHVEAGLRTYDLEEPFPEEFNRRAIALAATMHLAPSRQARENLLREGIDGSRIGVVGNTCIDALLWTLRDRTPGIPQQCGRFRVVVTCHRRESWDSGIAEVCEAVAGLVAAFDQVEVLFPTHPNPKVSAVVQRVLGSMERVTIVAPLGYREFCHAMADCDLLITDSGGIQEEALALGKPTLVTRWKTERPEVLETRTVQIVGPDRERIVTEASKLILDREHYDRCATAAFPFGRGESGREIASRLAQFYQADFVGAPGHQPSGT